MLADFFLARDAGRYLMILPRALADAVKKRLQMFVMRSRVQIGEGGESWELLGVAGARAAEALGAGAAAGTVIEVPRARSMLAIPSRSAPDAWKSLSLLRPVGSPCWEWLDIRSGVPMILPATQDKLVPQMANLELIGGVSFTKGCYTGQEVVARAIPWQDETAHVSRQLASRGRSAGRRRLVQR